MAKVSSAPNLAHRSKRDGEDCSRFGGSGQPVEELGKVEGRGA